MNQRTCKRCGESFPARTNKQYCRDACRVRATRERNTPSPPRVLSCQWPRCAALLGSQTGRGRNRKWCAEHRRHKKARDESARRAQLSTPCSIDGCERFVIAIGLCRTHYSKKLRAEGRIKADPWDDRRRDNYHARRARMAGARNGDRALLAEIVERDGVACSWCGEAVDLGISWPDAMSKSIDHTTPISRGGVHSLANTTLMHLSCNSSKGARVA